MQWFLHNPYMSPLRAAAIVRENLEDIAKLDVKDNGKPIWEAR